MPRVKKCLSTPIIEIPVDNCINEPTIVKLKRGRKSKKELEEINKQKNIDESKETNEIITISIENNSDNDDNNINDDNNDINDNDNDNDTNLSNKPVAKKRGRKPKGGKIIQQIMPIINNKETKTNIILHLKCSLKDLENNSSINYSIESFDFASNKNELNYELIDKVINYNINEDSNNNNDNENDNKEEYCNYLSNANANSNETNIKEIWRKLKQLEHSLHNNNVTNKKSSCFWCTCEFDNPQIYIPKHFIKESYQVYGCFCSPECATAYLMNENIDSSAKFERYYLLNHIYAKIYNYTKNIKPAPNPYYILDKFCGNLSIQEYRALLNNERLFLIVDKPLTRIFPELHEDNDDFIINNKIIPSNTYQIKKKIQKKGTTSKNNIVNEKFGLMQ